MIIQTKGVMGHFKESAYSQQYYVDHFVRTDILKGIFRSMSQLCRMAKVTPIVKKHEPP